MNITTSRGSYQIIQTVKNQDELLILANWMDLARLFDSKRIFLVNKKESLFGIYLCKQECAQKLFELIKNIDYKDWDHLNLDNENLMGKITA